MRNTRYLLTLIILAAVVAVSAFAWKSMKSKPEPTPSPTLSPIVQEVEQPSPMASAPAQLEGKNFILQNPTVQAVETSNVSITFAPESAFKEQDKLGITKRIVEPYQLYQRELNGTQELQTIEISQNNQASAKDFPFLFSAKFDGGVNESFVIGRQGDSFNWYVPECLGGCPFSDNFKAKYPEIVKLAQ